MPGKLFVLLGSLCALAAGCCGSSGTTAARLPANPSQGQQPGSVGGCGPTLTCPCTDPNSNFSTYGYCGVCASAGLCLYCPPASVCPSDPCNGFCPTVGTPTCAVGQTACAGGCCPSDYPLCQNSGVCCPQGYTVDCGNHVCAQATADCPKAG